MSKITNITVTNIKGFGTTSNTFNVDIISNKINILVAPNGFGKSSITTAFNSLKSGKLELGKDDYHKGDDTLTASLSLIEDGYSYTATKLQNRIPFKVFCIKNRLYAKAVSKNMGKFSSTTGHLAIDDFIVMNSIPAKEIIPYSINEIKTSFGGNSKILPNINAIIFQDTTFLHRLDDLYDSLQKFATLKRQNYINNILDSINVLSGNKDLVVAAIDDTFFDEIKTDSNYLAICHYIKNTFPSLTETDVFLYFFQIQWIFHNHKTILKNAVKRAAYEIFKNNFDKNINLLGATWKNIKSKEEKGSLVVHFPKAADISYGQRDVLTLCITLQEIKSKIRIGDKCIIIMDEVFDYLDEVNLTATQYYLSETLNDLGKICTIYPIIMTHLSPEYFRNYVFSPKKMNVQYLKEGQARPNLNMKKLLVKRGDKTVAEAIKNDIDHYLLHFSQGTINRKSDFLSLGLLERWGDTTYFLQFIINETNKYLSGGVDFDPYAVCTAVRIRIEKIVYDKLPTSAEKNIFIGTHKTKCKLEYAESVLGVSLPDIYYMLGIIYNDAQHLNYVDSEKPVVYRLNSVIIQDMIKKIFSFTSTTHITLSHIH